MFSDDQNPYGGTPPLVSTDDRERQVGDQVRRLRLDQGLDQLEVARRADLSPSTVQALETGRGSTLRTLIRVLRALGADGALGNIAPASAVSPLDVLRSSGDEPRRRVYRPRGGRSSGGGS
ncbi:helix-turn-helix domain-containing protein [Frigoribacterium sp. PhB24]|uniref:helix-turn-helix domain-containing protein n=1 Tax=Frigoribacterium sp. PhB24 TaxID=2485204 RepID=UPI000F9E862C|nr:helix-turn-helix transcriptional regulator [Frigoribacterium sp. PhB24]ROS54581.1 helix-turn-helix protein [Frigoribacterium sp. PhB24]